MKYFFLLFINMVLLSSLNAQIGNSKDTAAKKDKILSGTKQINEQKLNIANLYADSLSKAGTIHIGVLNKSTKHFTDSLITASKDSLSSIQRDSLLNHSLKIISQQGEPFIQWIQYSDKQKNALALKLAKSQTDYSGKTLKDDSIKNILEDYTGYADSLADIFTEDLDKKYDKIIDALDSLHSASLDSLDSYKDRLIESRQQLIEAIEDKKEAVKDSVQFVKEHGTRLEIASSYTLHDTYRGRDLGFDYNYLTPTVTFYHKSGFSAFASASYLMGQKKSPKYDSGVLGIGYEHVFSDIFTGSVGYSHGFYSDSSKQAKSINPNSLFGELAASLDQFNLDLWANVDFGTGKEYSITFTPSYQFEIENIFHDGTISIEPGILFNLGTQDEESTILRKQKTKGTKAPKATGTVSSSQFSILSYEPNISLSFEKGFFEIKSVVSYIMPENILDNSTDKGYISAMINLSFTIR